MQKQEQKKQPSLLIEIIIRKALQHLSKEEFLALQNLRKNKNIIIQESDSSNSVVIVAKADYLDKIENLLNDKQKFEKINLKNDGILNFTVNQEKCVDDIFKKLVAPNSISEEKGDLLSQLELGQV